MKSKRNNLRLIVMKGVVFATCSTVAFATSSFPVGNTCFATEYDALVAEQVQKEMEEVQIKKDLTQRKLELINFIPEPSAKFLLQETSVLESKLYSHYKEETEENLSSEEVIECAILPITQEEYYRLCCMTFAESGFCSWEMNNGCASAAINQAIQEQKTINEILDTPGRFGNGVFKFRDYAEDGSYVKREVEISDITPQVYDAVNQALLGYDVNEKTIGGTLGFYAPNYCSAKTNAYFEKHVRGTTMIENVCFYHEWVD